MDGFPLFRHDVFGMNVFKDSIELQVEAVVKSKYYVINNHDLDKVLNVCSSKGFWKLRERPDYESLLTTRELIHSRKADRAELAVTPMPTIEKR